MVKNKDVRGVFIKFKTIVNIELGLRTYIINAFLVKINFKSLF
jgi:hypothetical protein